MFVIKQVLVIFCYLKTSSGFIWPSFIIYLSCKILIVPSSFKYCKYTLSVCNNIYNISYCNGRYPLGPQVMLFRTTRFRHKGA